MGYRNYSTATSHIIDATGQGDFVSISTALTALAGAGTNNTTPTLLIRPGTYTENNTYTVACNIVAYPGDGLEGNVIIKGNNTISSAITIGFSGIQFLTNSAACLTISGSAASVVNCNGCYFNLGTSGIVFSSSSASAALTLNNCTGNISTTGVNVFAHSSAGNLNFNYTQFQNTGASTTANTQSAGGMGINYSSFMNPTTTSGSTALFASMASSFNTAAQNVIAVTHGCTNATPSNFVICQFYSGTASAISVSASCTLGTYFPIVSSSNTNYFTGSGAIEVQGLINSNIVTGSNNVTTQTTSGQLLGLRNGVAPSAGFIGEQIKSAATAQSASNGTPYNITSISLTAGIWDISIIGVSNASVAQEAFQIGIGTTTATFAGNSGEQFVVTQVAAGATSLNIGLSIPAFRVAISATTTYYLVAQINFASGTANAGGTIKATRVG